jgi:hypothetical protein
VLESVAPKNDPHHDSTLTEIMHLVDMEPGVTGEGWNPESARLFAIDTALMAARRNLLVLSEADRQNLAFRLQEARTLVVGGRDSELGFIQAALESHLSQAVPGRQRRMWLTAIDALIPSPYRAALVSTKNALSLGSTEALADLSRSLRERLLARLGEGSLVDPPSLFLIA